MTDRIDPLPPMASAAPGPLVLAGVTALVAVLAVVTISTRPDARRTRPAPPVLAAVPDFALVDQEGHTFGTAELRGRPWVASFIFTRCTTVCPALTARMAEVQARAARLSGLGLVSFSVDPEHDTPEVLAGYAARFGAGPRWRFLTGPFDGVRAAVEGGLRVAMGREAGGPVVDPAQLLHGSHFVLVDGDGRVRGYYDVRDERGLGELLEDLGALARARRA